MAICSDNADIVQESCLFKWGRNRVREHTKKGVFKTVFGPGPGAQLDRALPPTCPGCGFGLRSRHTQESTSECRNKWNNKLMFLSL